ncbi:11004_t:CDS:2 [Ambispora leptoticha]|uniref:11004_t:CDS:1 n=1 Tax=Ambispora leptoticha TaxID=144679 RepID=A0A9N9E0A4_9GLOM|nr:11004_t:CDS:2 [Ambispora leptoticha]
MAHRYEFVRRARKHGRHRFGSSDRKFVFEFSNSQSDSNISLDYDENSEYSQSIKNRSELMSVDSSPARSLESIKSTATNEYTPVQQTLIKSQPVKGINKAIHGSSGRKDGNDYMASTKYYLGGNQ